MSNEPGLYGLLVSRASSNSVCQEGMDGAVVLLWRLQLEIRR